MGRPKELNGIPMRRPVGHPITLGWDEFPSMGHPMERPMGGTMGCHMSYNLSHRTPRGVFHRQHVFAWDVPRDVLWAEVYPVGRPM